MKHDARLLGLSASHQAYELEIKACLIGLGLLSGDGSTRRRLTSLLYATVERHADGERDAGVDVPVILLAGAFEGSRIVVEVGMALERLLSARAAHDEGSYVQCRPLTRDTTTERVRDVRTLKDLYGLVGD